MDNNIYSNLVSVWVDKYITGIDEKVMVSSQLSDVVFGRTGASDFRTGRLGKVLRKIGNGVF